MIDRRIDSCIYLYAGDVENGQPMRILGFDRLVFGVDDSLPPFVFQLTVAKF